ncbi:MAG: hypothetical protein M1833_006474 [Piccolia ochrophora]|nr:MAG: hypothetical protein M1833_006474 [Piccolia ochrophora]
MSAAASASSTIVTDAGSPTQTLSTSQMSFTTASTPSDNTLKIGIGVGVGLGVPLALALAAALVMIQRNRHLRRRLKNSGLTNELASTEGTSDMVKKQQERPQLEQPLRHELDTSWGPTELNHTPFDR